MLTFIQSVGVAQEVIVRITQVRKHTKGIHHGFETQDRPHPKLVSVDPQKGLMSSKFFYKKVPKDRLRMIPPKNVKHEQLTTMYKTYWEPGANCAQKPSDCLPEDFTPEVNSCKTNTSAPDLDPYREPNLKDTIFALKTWFSDTYNFIVFRVHTHRCELFPLMGIRNTTKIFKKFKTPNLSRRAL